ncbi:MAG: Rieske (2Fe-2S) protein [Hyphomonadaceae bacterium]
MSNRARPQRGTHLARLAEIEDGAAIVRDFAEGEARFSLLIAREGDRAFAYENTCPHARMPLDTFDGRALTQDGVIVCATHGACFDLRSGACVGGPARAPLTRIAVSIENGAILMD